MPGPKPALNTRRFGEDDFEPLHITFKLKTECDKLFRDKEENGIKENLKGWHKWFKGESKV